jgi:nitroreductase / dihydropteridine reductase
MNIVESLEWRYASKRMNGQKVPADKVNNILEAIRLAPTSMGLQPFTVFVIENEELKNKIKPVAMNQPQITENSHLLVFAAWDNVTPEHVDEYISYTAQVRNMPEEALADFKNMLLGMTSANTPEQNFTWAAKQAYLALGTALVAAAAEQVDATPMEGFDSAALDQILNLKEQGLRSVTMLPLGYRDTENDWLVNLPKVRRQKEKLFIHQ